MSGIYKNSRVSQSEKKIIKSKEEMKYDNLNKHDLMGIRRRKGTSFE